MILEKLNELVWGSWLVCWLLGTGGYFMYRMDFLPLKNLKGAITLIVKPEKQKGEKGQVSPFAALTTELASTIGTGNIVGVAGAMALGGPGALFWMVAGSLLGMATKLAESMLAVKYRGKNEKGENTGGPMYTWQNRWRESRWARGMGLLFAVFAVLASLGMGNMVQSNSIADALWLSFSVEKAKTGLFLSVLTILVVLGGIGSIGKVTAYLVPFMGIFYLFGICGILMFHFNRIPQALAEIVLTAFCPKAVAGGLFGTIRVGISRGIFSNEAGLGAAGISAASADTEDYVRQGYISMTGVFWDTIVMCSLTGLALAVSGVFGQKARGMEADATGLVLGVFQDSFGRAGNGFVSICIALFAFATILGWAYQGEKAFEFLAGGKSRYCVIYRLLYGLAVFAGCLLPLETVWTLSDICNGCMAVPNLICLWLLSGEVCSGVRQRGRLD